MGATPATAFLERAGVDVTEYRYGHDPRHPSFGREAAEALDVDPASVFKTLICTTGTQSLTAIVSVHHHLDCKALAAAIGVRNVELADVSDAERLTGYVHGAISPFAQRTDRATYLDISASLHPRIYVSGGRRGLEIGISPDDLIRLTSAVLLPLARATPATHPSPPAPK
jgi:Cys-tRNA(Pro)/Cys-tRNA(Cys) deacylase